MGHPNYNSAPPGGCHAVGLRCEGCYPRTKGSTQHYIIKALPWILIVELLRGIEWELQPNCSNVVCFLISYLQVLVTVKQFFTSD